MRIINRYIIRNFLITFLMALLVFTFILSIGVIFKITDLLAQGASWRPILQIFIYGIPSALAFAIPISTLVGTLLVFGRLSSDGETTAMRACGISLLQISVSPILFSLILSMACFYISNEFAPLSHYARRNIISQLNINPVKLLEEGRFIQDFAGLTVYIGKKKGNQLNNVIIYDQRKQGIRREIRAKFGTINIDGDDLLIRLFDGRVDPFFDDRPGAMSFGKWPIKIENAFQKRKRKEKEDDMTIGELINHITAIKSYFPNLHGRDMAIQKMIFIVELNKRLVLSLSCFAFVLLSIPFGIKTHRKESSLGIAMSLFFVFNFYLFIIIGESLANQPEVYPHLILWIPVFIASILGTKLILQTS